MIIGKKNSFNAVNIVLNKVMSNLGLDRRLREHSFMTLWTTFVSSGIGDRSRAIYIDAERNLVVSVADAATGQELSMVKGKVLQKLVPAARSLNIEIRGLRLDLKHYHSGLAPSCQTIEEVKPLPKPSAQELAQVPLSSADQAELAALQLELDKNGEQNALKERLLQIFASELKLRTWQLAHGYPLCQRCGNPSERLHELKFPGAVSTMVCLSCRYQD